MASPYSIFVSNYLTNKRLDLKIRYISLWKQTTKIQNEKFWLELKIKFMWFVLKHERHFLLSHIHIWCYHMSFSKCEPKSFYVLLAKEKFKLRRKIKKIVHFICIKVSKNYYAIEVCFIVGKNRKYTTGIKLIESLHKDLEQISCPMSISGDFVKFFRNSVKLTK